MTSTISRRGFLAATAGASALGFSGIRPAHAAFPERGITVVVPYGAGGGTDITARLLAKDLEAVLGKPVTVENRAGGGGWVGWGSLAQSKPDGYTIGYLNVPNISPAISTSSRGIAQGEPRQLHAADQPRHRLQHVVGEAGQPFKTVKDVIEEAKKRPGTITLNGGGHGTDDHVAVARHRRRQRHQASRWCTSAARRTARPRCWAATSRSTPATSARCAEDVKAGMIRPLGVMSPARSKFMPERADLPRAGLQRGLVDVARHRGPAGLPKDVQDALIAALEKTIGFAGAQGEGRGAVARPGRDQGRRLPQVPEGQRAGHQDADELVAVGSIRLRSLRE